MIESTPAATPISRQIQALSLHRHFLVIEYELTLKISVTFFFGPGCLFSLVLSTRAAQQPRQTQDTRSALRETFVVGLDSREDTPTMASSLMQGVSLFK